MKKNFFFLFFATCTFISIANSSFAQSVTTARQTIDKQDYSGLVLHSAIPDKDLANYWQEYLKQFGKVNGKKGAITVNNAYVKRIGNQPVQMVSNVTGGKGNSQVFIAVNVDGSYVNSTSDRYYRDVEDLLKDFASFAAERDEVKLAQTNLQDTSKESKNLKKEGSKLAKKISKTEKDLEKLRQELTLNEQKQAQIATELERRKSDLDTVKSRVSN